MAHRPCLVIGRIVEESRSLAREIAYELGRPVTWATHVEHDVTDFAAVHLTCGIADMLTSPALVLVGEAFLAGVDVHEPLAADEVAQCPCGLVGRHVRIPVGADGERYCAECREESSCSWCGEWNDVEDLDIVERDGTWYPAHRGCLTGSRGPTPTDVLVA
ncbi:hypothetical protein ACFY7A_35620 [Streptomyces longwoodensis]|uniref:hypothetical protein n=1 Tax=Streptomyces longwoodensis TaxID=68231 RepID=UPI0036BB7533